jgi:hypothetical protein
VHNNILCSMLVLRLIPYVDEIMSLYLYRYQRNSQLLIRYWRKNGSMMGG